MANRKSTVRKKDAPEMATYNVSPGNFWDIGNYSRCITRIRESNELLDDLVTMFKERIAIEQKYSEKLGKWHEKWSKLMEVAPLYATMKTAVLGTLKEANDIAQIHQDSYIKVENQVIQNIKSHKEQYYHKALMGLKEAKSYEEEFAKAQKQWAGAYGKVHRSKKAFHAACKNRENATQQLNVANKDSEVTHEKIKKLEESVNKCEKVVGTMKKKYEEKLSRIGPLNSSYEEEMRSVYNRWAKDEDRRKTFIQRTLLEYHKAVNIVDDKRLKECYENQLNVAYSGKSQYDVKWWSENFGADMPRNWPKFEEYKSLDWKNWSLNSLSSNQRKQGRRFTTRPQQHPYLTSAVIRELGDMPDAPPPVSAVEPPPSQNYHAQYSSQQSNNVAQQEVPTSVSEYSIASSGSGSNSGSTVPVPSNSYPSMPVANNTYASVQRTNEAPAVNPFDGGSEDDKDGFDEEDDDDWDDAPPPPLPGGGIPVRALYDYNKVEDDELSFNAGDVVTKLTEEDGQGWCRGRLNGIEGLYPANYVENI